MRFQAILDLEALASRIGDMPVKTFSEFNEPRAAQLSSEAQQITQIWSAAVQSGLEAKPEERAAFFNACQSFRKTTRGVLRGFFQQDDAAWHTLATRHRSWLHTVAVSQRRAEHGVIALSINAHHGDADAIRTYAKALMTSRGIDPLKVDCRTRRNQHGAGRPRRMPNTDFAAAAE